MNLANLFSFDLKKLNKDDLKSMCYQFGVSAKGTKNDLCEKLYQCFEEWERENPGGLAEMELGKSMQQGGAKEYYFVDPNEIDEQQQRYCRCVLHVAGKQSPECLKKKAWKKTVGGQQCVNPYSACTSSVGRTKLNCFQHYSINNIPADELNALMYLKGKNREQLFNDWEEARAMMGKK